MDAKSRAAIYRLLSFGYHYPPREEDLAAMASVADKSFSDLARLARETPAESLAQDFNDLFMVPVAKYTAPYESVYLDDPFVENEKSQLRTFGPSTQAVMAFYQRIGLKVSPSYTELPDYIGLELACMEFLCAKEAEYTEAGDAEAAAKARAFQCTFLRDHLDKWIPRIAARIREKAETEYYRALAALTLDWVRQEASNTQPPTPKEHPTPNTQGIPTHR